MNDRRRLREWLTRGGLVLFGLLLTVVVLEVGLQAASWIVRSTTDRPEAAVLSAGRMRVLCLGDSNTFGLYLQREQAYPARFEELWNASKPAPQLEVVNFGYPGTTSSRLLRDLDSILDTFMPSVVVLMVGVNDSWVGPTEVRDESVPVWSRLKRHSRLYRFYRILRAAPADTDIERLKDPERSMKSHRDRLRVGDREFDVGLLPASPENLANRTPLERNLQRLVERTRDRGIEVHLMTYPARARLYRAANRVIRRFARGSKTSLVNLEAIFERRCSSVECPELLFHDGHPRAEGYEVVAKALRDHIARRMAR